MSEEAPETGPTTPSTPQEEPESPAPGPQRSPLHDPYLIGVLVAAFSVFYFILSYLRYSEFYSGNWDLGVNMQALWTNTHGYLLYVSVLSQTSGGGSFLLVHTTYLAIPVSWLYALVPTAETLFALQALVVASSAIPLYLIGKRADVPRSLLYAGVFVYLVSFPIVAAVLFDFHWEAFVSIEFLWTFYLLDSGHKRLAFVPLILGTFTLEVFPFLVAGIGLYFAYPYIKELLTTRKLAPDSRRSLLFIIVFVAVGLILFVLLAYVRQYTIPQITGTHLVLKAIHPYTTVSVGITWWGGIGFTALAQRLLYWFLLVCAFGLIPLLYRQRLLILSLPWFCYTVFMTPLQPFTQMGYQYAFIAAAPLGISLISGLADFGAQLRGQDASRLPLAGWLLLLAPILASSLWYSRTMIDEKGPGLWVAFVAACLVAVAYLGVQWARRFSRAPQRVRARAVARAFRSRWALRVAAVVAIGALVALNVAMSPLEPANEVAVFGNGYSFSWHQSPSFTYMPAIIADIDPQQTVVASDNLFPFVANNPHAYSLLWYPGGSEILPFNASHLPQYALLSTNQWAEVPNFLSSALFTPKDYGIRDVLYTSYSYPGTIYLFEFGYTGTANVVEATPYPSSLVLCGHDLALGGSGIVQPDADSRCGSIIESSPAANLSGIGGVIWYGPYATLLAGRYTVTVSLMGSFSGPGPTNPQILWMDASAVGTGYWYKLQVTANEISPTHWTNLTFHFTLNESHPHAEWRGYVSGEKVNGVFVPGFAELNYIQVDYTPLPASG